TGCASTLSRARWPGSGALVENPVCSAQVTSSMPGSTWRISDTRSSLPSMNTRATRAPYYARRTRSFDHDAIAGAAAERLGHVHLLGARRRHDEAPRRGRPRDVVVGVDAFPQQRGERLGALVAQVLMLVPRPVPPPVPVLRGRLAWIG